MPHHVLLVTFPAQGHINPTLQFTKRLISLGVRVTYMTTDTAINRMNKESLSNEELSFTSFSEGDLKLDDLDKFVFGLEHCGSRALRELIASNAKQGMLFDHIVYSILLPWVADVAHEFQLPTTFLWIQPASIFNIYYYYMKDHYGDIIRKNIEDSSFPFELPGLPVILNNIDLPSFFFSSSPYKSGLELLRKQVDILDGETKPRVLVNTFDALEPKALQAIQNFNLVGVGPLIPSAFLDGKNPSDASFGGDLFKGTKDNHLQWLDSMPQGSVVYVSFGSMAVLEKTQKDETARGLLATGFPFLWVIRDIGQGEKEDDQLSCIEQLEKQGMIVSWCSQVEVLSHPSVGCFLTHCGWNSTLEGLTSGVPMVAVPQWSDQGTNSKLVQDMWKTGIRVAKNGKGIVESQEIKKCLELVMGDEEMRQNARKWKDMAREAIMEGGSSDSNLKAFVDGLGEYSCT